MNQYSTISCEQLKEILRLHKLWLEGKDGGVRADLGGADLLFATLPAFSILPEEGQFVAWKKVQALGGAPVILKLLITGRRVSTPMGRKCRTDTCIVLAAYGPDGSEQPTASIFISNYNHAFSYRIGATISVTEDEFNPDIRVECTGGIHFFLTRKEAEDYQF